MPEQQPPGPLTGTDLSARLHHLAAHGTAPAPATGAQVRGRAVRRRRNRRAALSTTVLAAAALTVVTTGVLDSPAKKATPPATYVSHSPRPAPSPVPVQRVTVDLDAYKLTIEGKTFRIGKPSPNCPIGETTVTVTAKYPTLRMPPEKVTQRVDVALRAVTFTDRSHHERLLLFTLNPDAGLSAIGNDFDAGAISLSPEDGKRVYDAIEPGARVEIKGHQGPKAEPDSVCVERQPITSDH
ncbi:L,D-transpeptidase [Streptomyces sp. NPDC047022]|uniref:L,D-transpeptidase n=1 Tax=Streptomyces sp. NPDC047022 TaxID=3155737 RepID=UPI0033FC79CD